MDERCDTKKASAASFASPSRRSMPIFVLMIKAELETVGKFWASEEHVWELDVQQSAGAEIRQGVQIDPDEQVEIPNSNNATANFLLKWPGDRNQSYAKVVKLPTLRPQTADDTAMVPFAAFECRGMEPVRWIPTGPYCVESPAGVLYEEVGFRDNEDWCEYDDKSGESMMINKDIEHKFVLHRG